MDLIYPPDFVAFCSDEGEGFVGIASGTGSVSDGDVWLPPFSTVDWYV